MITTSSNAELSEPAVASASESAPKASAERSSYGQILKSSTFVEGSSVVNTAIGTVRTEVMAVLPGPAGFGLFGLYGSNINLTQSVAEVGINSSGVRQIAAAVGSDDGEQMAQTTIVLRRTSVLLGVLGSAGLALFFRQVSMAGPLAPRSRRFLLGHKLVAEVQVCLKNWQKLAPYCRCAAGLPVLGGKRTERRVHSAAKYLYFQWNAELIAMTTLVSIGRAIASPRPGKDPFGGVMAVA